MMGSHQNKAGEFSKLQVIQSPYSRKIRVETGLQDAQEIRYNLYDINGSILHSDTAFAASFEFDPGYLPEGVYFLKLVIDGKAVVEKLFIRE